VNSFLPLFQFVFEKFYVSDDRKSVIHINSFRFGLFLFIIIFYHILLKNQYFLLRKSKVLFFCYCNRRKKEYNQIKTILKEYFYE